MLLFDEIEKAHPSVYDVFLQVLSDGRLTDRMSRTVSFEDTIIIMTTNIGQPHFVDPDVSFEQAEQLALTDLSSTYKPELLNRFAGRQNIVCFNRLGLDDIQRIVQREIGKVDAAYRERGVAVAISDASLRDLCASLYDPKIGARGIPGYIKAHVEPVIVNSTIDNPERRGTFNIRFADGALAIELSQHD